MVHRVASRPSISCRQKDGRLPRGDALPTSSDKPGPEKWPDPAEGVGFTAVGKWSGGGWRGMGWEFKSGEYQEMKN